jgi:hypothetical protein
MLKLGKVIVPDIDVVTLRLEEFCISRMEWLEPFEVSLYLERKPFANGAFWQNPLQVCPKESMSLLVCLLSVFLL